MADAREVLRVSAADVETLREALELGLHVWRTTDKRVLFIDEAFPALARLEALAGRGERLEKAAVEAMASLATGPMKDGYAYAVLDAALATAPEEGAGTPDVTLDFARGEVRYRRKTQP